MVILKIKLKAKKIPIWFNSILTSIFNMQYV